MLITQNPALLIIDLQEAIDHIPMLKRSNPNMEQAISNTLKDWRTKKYPIIHIKHSSKFLESPYHKTSKYFEFKKVVEPLDNEKVIIKQENSAFIHTELNKTLKSLNVKELVICGVLTNNSIDATVRVGSALGYTIYLPFDLTASSSITLFDGKIVSANDVQNIFLSNLDDEYCTICYSENLLT